MDEAMSTIDQPQKRCCIITSIGPALLPPLRVADGLIHTVLKAVLIETRGASPIPTCLHQGQPRYRSKFRPSVAAVRNPWPGVTRLTAIP